MELDLRSKSNKCCPSVFGMSYPDMYSVLQHDVVLKAMDAEGNWAASVTVPPPVFTRKQDHLNFTNTETIVFPALDHAVEIILLGLFSEGKLKLVVEVNADVYVYPDMFLAFHPGDLIL